MRLWTFTRKRNFENRLRNGRIRTFLSKFWLTKMLLLKSFLNRFSKFFFVVKLWTHTHLWIPVGPFLEKIFTGYKAKNGQKMTEFASVNLLEIVLIFWLWKLGPFYISFMLFIKYFAISNPFWVKISILWDFERFEHSNSKAQNLMES